MPLEIPDNLTDEQAREILAILQQPIESFDSRMTRPQLEHDLAAARADAEASEQRRLEDVAVLRGALERLQEENAALLRERDDALARLAAAVEEADERIEILEGDALDREVAHG